ncbi:MAG: MAPEG family protein [Alphaproteobacteria bacterium]|nr:MAPEG family protein [Alphaproteobacteria bacterium]
MEKVIILQPLIALGLWTGVMMIWMYATRIPAMTAAGIDPQNGQHPHQLADGLPSEVARIADNYNHLFEQPTLFYATLISIAVLGHGDNLAVQLAWAFVALRVAHSLVQATFNKVLLRFGIFIVSWAVLLVLIVREALIIF